MNESTHNSPSPTTRHAHPEVLIVLVNFNNTADTIDCINSIKENEHKTPYKIFLIDNGSKDFDRANLAAQFPEIEITETGKNLGFSAGINIGINKALAENIPYTLLLNNDTIVTPDFITDLISTLKTNPQYGIVAPLITYYDNSDIIWFRGGSFNKYTSITRHTDMNKDKRLFATRASAASTDSHSPAFPTQFITGCCMLIKTDIFKKVGLFDEQYFLYNEDLDFCYRCQKQGIKFAVNPAVEIMHKVSGATNKDKNTTLDPHRFTKIKAYYSARNDLLFIKKNLHGIPKLTSFISSFCIKYPYFSLQMLKRKQFAELKEYFRGILDGIRYKISKHA
jgi:hypothetical protein